MTKSTNPTEIHPCCIPINSPINRHQRRLMGLEYNRLLKHLPDFEKLFISDLFDETIPVDYRTLYNFHLDNCREVIRWVAETCKPRYWILDEKYFADAFSPLGDVSEAELNAEINRLFNLLQLPPVTTAIVNSPLQTDEILFPIQRIYEEMVS